MVENGLDELCGLTTLRLADGKVTWVIRAAGPIRSARPSR